MARRRKSRPTVAAPARPAAPSPPPARGAFAGALILGLAGLVLSVLLARLHARAHAGFASFCAVNDAVNCDRVALSRFSVLFGLPVAAWGAFGYGLASALAAWGLAKQPSRGRWPSGLLFLVAAAAVAASLALALVSKLAIGAWCLLCAATWAIAVALLVAAWQACRPPGVPAAIRADLALVRESPRGALALAGAVAAAVAVTAALYPRYWDRPHGAGLPAQPAPAPAGPGAGTGGGPAGAAAPAATVNVPEGVVIEYSDYECPYCARAHEETRAILSSRPDITLVRRHFPLDGSCNPSVARTIHPSACALARAAICAEEQGRFAEMDDALFRNQRERLPPAVLAERIGLDLARFGACVGSRDTERRLAADVAAGLRDGVRATPTYLVGRTLSAGRFPAELLTPAPARAAP
jgi:protein-disulfide isomerase